MGELDSMAKVYYTAEEVAEELRVSQRTLYRYIEAGRLQGIKPENSRKWLFTRADIDAFVYGDEKGRHVNRKPQTDPQDQPTK